MGAIIFGLGLIGFLVLFVYLKFPPAYANMKLVGVYNSMVLGVCTIMCLVWTWYIYTDWKGTSADQWWPFAASGGALLIEICFLFLCFMARNFWIFKPPRRPGSFGF